MSNRVVVAFSLISMWVLTLSPSPLRTAAQESSGAAVPASECSVVPLAPQDFMAVVRREYEALGDPPVGTPVVEIRPEGATLELLLEGTVVASADRALASLPAPAPQVNAALVATLRLEAACLNAGDVLRLYALYTDARLVELVRNGRSVEPAPSLEDWALAVVSAPVPRLPEDQLGVPTIVGSWELQDGRAAALVQRHPASAGQSSPLLIYVFRQTSGTWLIEDAKAVIDPAATPVPDSPIDEVN